MNLFLRCFILLASVVAALGASKTDIRESGAKGDGQALDTAAIQKAIDTCAEGGGGQVVFPPGRYLSGTIHLRSNVTLHLEAGARLIGKTNLAQYDRPQPPDIMPEARWGKWHRGLIVGENVQDIAITGLGVIDGNKVFDPTGEERMRGPRDNYCTPGATSAVAGGTLAPILSGSGAVATSAEAGASGAGRVWISETTGAASEFA